MSENQVAPEPTPVTVEPQGGEEYNPTYNPDYNPNQLPKERMERSDQSGDP